MLQKRLDAQIEYISSLDGAIDREAPGFDWDKYTATLDAKHLPIKAGSTPTVFVLQGLSRDVLGVVVKGFDSSAQWERIEAFDAAVKYGLKRVRNFKNAKGDDVELKFEQSSLGEGLDKASINAIYDPQLFIELGSKIYEASRVHPL